MEETRNACRIFVWKSYGKSSLEIWASMGGFDRPKMNAEGIKAR
jgi:hypothetical protein